MGGGRIASAGRVWSPRDATLTGAGPQLAERSRLRWRKGAAVRRGDRCARPPRAERRRGGWPGRAVRSQGSAALLAGGREPHWLKAVPTAPPPPMLELTLERGRLRGRVAPAATAAARGPPTAHPPGSLGRGPSRTPPTPLCEPRAHASSSPSPRLRTRTSPTGREARGWAGGGRVRPRPGREAAAVCHRRDRGVGSHPCHDPCVRPPGPDPHYHEHAQPPLAHTPPRCAVKLSSDRVVAPCPPAVAVAVTAGRGGRPRGAGAGPLLGSARRASWASCDRRRRRRGSAREGASLVGGSRRAWCGGKRTR